MKKLLIQCKTSAAFESCKQELSFRTVAYFEKEYSNNNLFCAEIEIDFEHKSDVQEWLHIYAKDVILTQLIPYQKLEDTKKKYRYALASLVIYALLASILCYKYWHFYQLSSFSKNFESNWSADNSVLCTKVIKTQEISSMFYDKNLDANWEMTETYNQNRLQNKVIDQNEDGFWDKSYQYDDKNNIIEQIEDRDKDTFWDNMFMVLENGDTLHFEDANRNGVWELKQ